MLLDYKRGQGSIVLRVKLLNSSVATGAGVTGLTSSSAGLIISTIADNEALATAYAQASSKIETISELGSYAAPTATKCRFKEVDATNHPGYYEIQIADARFAVSNAKSVTISLSGATNLAETDVLVPLRDIDPYDAVRGGMSALPNADAQAPGGLYTRGTGAGQIKQSADGQIDANAVSAVAAFVEDMMTVDSGKTSRADAVSGSMILETAKAIWDRVLTGVTHGEATSAGRRLRGIQEFQGYALGRIWIDTVNGTAGTTDYENGTVERPVDSIADANTLNASLNFNQFNVGSGSSITFAATQANQAFFGQNWTLALGTRNIAGTYIEWAKISGVSTGSNARLVNCEVAAVTMAPCIHVDCIYTNSGSGFTMGSAGSYFFMNPKSGVAGNNLPVWTWDGGGASRANFRLGSGGVKFENMKSGDVASVEGFGQFIEGTCAGGAVTIRGMFTTSGISNIVLTEAARYDIERVLAGTITELSSIPGASPTLLELMSWLYLQAKNGSATTNSNQETRKDDGSVLANQSLDDNGTRLLRGKYAAP